MDLDTLLAHMIQIGGSDLHLKVDSPPMVCIDATLTPLVGEGILDDEALDEFVAQVTQRSPAKRESFYATGDLDTASVAEGFGRFRVNGFRQRGAISFAFRYVPKRVPSSSSSAFRPASRSSRTSTADSPVAWPVWPTSPTEAPAAREAPGVGTRSTPSAAFHRTTPPTWGRSFGSPRRPPRRPATSPPRTTRLPEMLRSPAPIRTQDGRGRALVGCDDTGVDLVPRAQGPVPDVRRADRPWVRRRRAAHRRARRRVLPPLRAFGRGGARGVLLRRARRALGDRRRAAASPGSDRPPVVPRRPRRAPGARAGPRVEWVGAALGASAFLFAAAVAKPGGMGQGDVKFALLLGAMLGKLVVVGMMLGFVAGLVPSVALLARHGVGARKMTIPFGPFLAFGAVLALFVGDRIWNAYVGSF